MTNNRCYFDHAASAFGNPSSLMHTEGRTAKQKLEDARLKCACVLGVPADTLFFTCGGTESNSIALFSALMRPSGRILYSAAEHASVREAVHTLEKMGKNHAVIQVDPNGKVTPELLTKTLNKHNDVRFVSIMSVNNETGTITDIPALRKAIDCYRTQNNCPPIFFHCDIVQAAGKIPVNITEWDIDSASISAHKLGGPRGIGLLYLKNGNKTDVFYKGGGQERGIRGGTENTEGASALADCLEKYAEPSALLANFENAKARWNKLIDSLTSMDRCVIIPKSRLESRDAFSPYILQAAFKDIPGEVMARALDDLGFAVSTGSACSSSSPERPVLMAMGVEEKLQIEGIRISQGFSTTEEEIALLVKAIKKVLDFL